MWGTMLSSSHLAARAAAAGVSVPADERTAFDEDEQTQRLRKLAEAPAQRPVRKLAEAS